MSEFDRELDEFDALGQEFESLGFPVAEPESLGPEWDELNAELSAAGLDDGGMESLGFEGLSDGLGGSADLSALADPGENFNVDAQIAAFALKGIVKKIIKALVKLIRRYGYLVRCTAGMRLLRDAIRAAGRKRWATALRLARQAFAAFNRCRRSR